MRDPCSAPVAATISRDWPSQRFRATGRRNDFARLAVAMISRDWPSKKVANSDCYFNCDKRLTYPTKSPSAIERITDDCTQLGINAKSPSLSELAL